MCELHVDSHWHIEIELGREQLLVEAETVILLDALEALPVKAGTERPTKQVRITEVVM